jgi:MFS family permease
MKNTRWDKKISAVVYCTTLMSVLGISSVTPALPKVALELNLEPLRVSLLVTAFALFACIFTPITGVLVDKLGRKKVLIPSLLLFGLSGCSCTFMPSFESMVVLRALQGVGAASLSFISITILSDLYSGRELVRMTGYNAGFLSIGTAAYPVIGGAVALLGWRYPFIISALAFPVAIMAYFWLGYDEPKVSQSISEYLVHMFKNMKNSRLLSMVIINILNFIMFYGVYVTYYPFYLKKYFNASVLSIGVILSSTSVAAAITSFKIKDLSRRLNETRLLMTAFFFYTITLFIIPHIPDLCTSTIPAILFGAARGMCIAAVHTSLESLSSPKQRGATLCMGGLGLRIGQFVGPLLMGAVFQLWGIKLIFYVGSFLSFAAFIFVLFSLGDGKSMKAAE